MSIALDTILVKSPGVCGGRLRVDGTRITVERIAVLYKQGHSAEEIVQTYPHLSLAQVYAALAWFHANRAEIEAALAAADAQYDALVANDPRANSLIVEGLQCGPMTAMTADDWNSLRSVVREPQGGVNNSPVHRASPRERS